MVTLGTKLYGGGTIVVASAKIHIWARQISGDLRYDSQPVRDAVNELYPNQLRILQKLLLPSAKLSSKTMLAPNLDLVKTNRGLNRGSYLNAPRESKRYPTTQTAAQRNDPFERPNFWSKSSGALLRWLNSTSARDRITPNSQPLIHSEIKLS